ncbi:NADH dehydrogenase [ubiquinone] 1 beta subcomplex subunit 5, mitochondrial [Hyla sarda]|uniref:NADH dehydrogenase [ubiquinone] 1 beta subcomplex subunit 5, mitochondrial n=1 Tax=Hyla sarda TaxID=327740 RepID=UPI0024C20D08|nr:NADH dehydrogenase [ubiquinone] 1 beta subcomplex subunit 5, mitochondrial [Hyla sarda]
MAAMSLLRSVTGSLVSRLQPVSRGVLGRSSLQGRGPPAAAVPVRFGSHGKKLFVMAPSTYYDNRFLHLLKFYTLLSAVPAGIAIALINIFIGPAELVETPEDYVPEPFEYYQHPITRFLSRHVFPDYQKSYEKEMCLIHVENEKRQLRLYETAARRSMRQNGDGPWFQFETLDKNLIDIAPKGVPDE